MNKQAFNNTHTASMSPANGALIRAHKGDAVKLVLTIVGVLCLLGIAGKAWVGSDTSQVGPEENEMSWQGKETDTVSTEIARTFLPGRQDRHDRIYRDFFVLSNKASSRDVNDTQTTELN